MTYNDAKSTLIMLGFSMTEKNEKYITTHRLKIKEQTYYDIYKTV